MFDYKRSADEDDISDEDISGYIGATYKDYCKEYLRRKITGMCQVSVKCPKCGTVNKDLYLEETKGWFECEECGRTSMVPGFKKHVFYCCPECECTEFIFQKDEERHWVATCKDCGHKLDLYLYYDGTQERNICIPIYEMKDIPKVFNAERRVL